jgi:hypothetical protein
VEGGVATVGAQESVEVGGVAVGDDLCLGNGGERVMKTTIIAIAIIASPTVV